MNNEKRNQEIFALHECGQSYSQLGIQFGLSPTRIMQIYKKEQNRVNDEKFHMDAVNGKIPFTFWDALKEVCETEMQSTRIFRCLNRAGIINEIESNHDTLDTYSDETLLSIKNFGRVSLIFARRANKLYQEKNSSLCGPTFEKAIPMTVKKTVKFNPDDILEQLSNLGVKRSYLGNQTSIYYVGYSNPVISKAFRTGEIHPQLLAKINELIKYLSNSKLRKPTLISFIELQQKNDILKRQVAYMEERDSEKVETLTEVIKQLSKDLMVYSEQFQRASTFLDYSIKEQTLQ